MKHVYFVNKENDDDVDDDFLSGNDGRSHSVVSIGEVVPKRGGASVVTVGSDAVTKGNVM